MQVKKQQLELDMEQQMGSKSRKEYVKAAYFHPAYLTYMQSTSCETHEMIISHLIVYIFTRVFATKTCVVQALNY